jgi:hypothetical protein
MFSNLKAFMVGKKSFLFLHGSFTFLHVKLTREKERRGKKRSDIYSNTLLDINMLESQIYLRVFLQYRLQESLLYYFHNKAI